MLLHPGTGGVKKITNAGLVGTLFPGTPLTPGITTFPAPTEVISAAQNVQDSWGIGIWIYGTGLNGFATEAAANIYIGGVTDSLLISSLLCGYALELPQGQGWHWLFPLHIPRGVRLAASISSILSPVSTKAGIVIELYGGCLPPWRVGRKVTTYGVKVNNNRGQAVTPGTSGAISIQQIVAATTEAHFAFMPGFNAGGDTTLAQAFVNVTIGIGASQEERIGTWAIVKPSTEDMGGPFPMLPAFRDVPAGTRLSLLLSHSNASNDTSYSGHIYAVS